MQPDSIPAPRGAGDQKNAQLQVSNYGADSLGIALDLAKFIKENKLSTQVQGKEFVNVEGWQYAGSRLGIVPIVETVTDCSTETELKYTAKVTLLNLSSGLTVGAGFAICSNKESGKKFYQEFAIASMAQTRAIGKAYRNILAWIIRAAGYEPTPAEEMDYAGNTAAAPAAAPAPNGETARPGGPVQMQQLAVPEASEADAPAAPKLKAPTPLPAEPEPSMQVNRSQQRGPGANAVAARTQRLQQGGILMSTPTQHALIRELLESVAITPAARNATLLNYLRFTHERAQLSIDRLVATITSAGEWTPENLLRKRAAIAEELQQLLVPGSRASAAATLRQFATANAEQLGKVETVRLLAICENPEFTAQQLVHEYEDGASYLNDQAA